MKNTPNTASRIVIPSGWDKTNKEELLRTLGEISNDDIERIWAAMQEAKEKRLQREKEEKERILEEMKNYREAWREKIEGISYVNKEKIIKATKKIPVKIEKDSDGSRLIEFKLWDKTYKILDPKLKTHTDDEYSYSTNWNKSDEYDELVEWRWMIGDDINQRENQKLKEYVHEKMEKWLHVVGRWDVYLILQELGKLADISEESDQMAMLMYLTCMDWKYYLKPWDKELLCYYGSRYIYPCKENYNSYSNLFMISVS